MRVFGMRENDGLALAHHLGRALQLTNILRDIDEDADIGQALSAVGRTAEGRHHHHRSQDRAGQPEPLAALRGGGGASARALQGSRPHHGAQSAHAS